LKKLEALLISHFRPTFFDIKQIDENSIHIIISCLQFNYLDIQSRIQDVFNLINSRIPDIMENTLIVVQAYNSEEMNELIGKIKNG